jgi:hypothetical protein
MTTENSEHSNGGEQEPNRTLEEYFVRTTTLEHLDFLFCLKKTLPVSIHGNPRLCSSLLRDERTRKFYQLKKLGLMLEEYGYDLSHHMGEVLLRQCRMDHLETIRVLYDVLFSNQQTLRSTLNDDRLWRLYKIRNLIVHRAGVVDELFLRSTGLSMELGTKLKVVPQQLEEFILLVARVGSEILVAASADPERGK